ncbi:HXXEE domain-containing protein [Pectobacterium wasabiae]|uniref:HXXEE domain-containing protein n=1 Tax=Pectobacterium wasabiae TaxID=55208 RepID=UPI00027B0C07|nr:HXXEE domain-containing protein [Pectobacterium wasabiae]AOR61803.1 hypothetical protein A7983_00620 [Pectobacterium wasabiae CFBP 3304]EJS95130.1 Hypothetical protein Y17_1340 [Pectobacterium wasabiae CFBP 3304]
MEFYRKYWCFFGGIIFVGLAYFLALQKDILSPIQVILTLSYMGFLVHQFEEYGIPGGFPSLGNVTFGEKKDFDRYPLNANLVMIDNVFITYPFYIIPIFFPDLIWLGLIQIGQAMVQTINHVFTNNIKLKSIYNPGMASVIFIAWPVGLYYIWYVHTNHLAHTSDYIIGFFGSFLSIFVLWLIPVFLLKNRNTNYAFSDSMLYGFNGNAKRKADSIRKADR